MRAPPPDPKEVSNIYVDESSQTKHRFLVLGGIILPATDVPAFNSAVSRARLPELPKGELKWVKVSRSKLEAYKRAIDVFFDGISEFVLLEFHSLVVDTPLLDDKRYNNGSRDIGFNKEVYQLLMKFGCMYQRGVFHAYPDRRSTTQETEDLRLMLNRGRASKGDQRDWPFRRLHFRDSEKEPLLQMVDLLIGSIAFRLNGHHLAENASPAKIALSDHILARARVRDVARDTNVTGKFTIWHRRLR